MFREMQFNKLVNFELNHFFSGAPKSIIFLVGERSNDLIIEEFSIEIIQILGPYNHIRVQSCRTRMYLVVFQPVTCCMELL